MEEAYAYIGVWDGTAHAACVDTGDKVTAEFVAEIVRDGGTLKRVTCEWVRQNLFVEGAAASI